MPSAPNEWSADRTRVFVEKIDKIIREANPNDEAMEITNIAEDMIEPIAEIYRSVGWIVSVNTHPQNSANHGIILRRPTP